MKHPSTHLEGLRLCDLAKVRTNGPLIGLSDMLATAQLKRGGDVGLKGLVCFRTLPLEGDELEESGG